MEAIYYAIDLAVTLRCNWKCKNCLRFCNMKNESGLSYEDSDMTISQIENFINQVEELSNKENRRVFEFIQVSGGEPLLHPNIVEIVQLLQKRLIEKKYCGRLIVNSNLMSETPKEIEEYIINYLTVEEKNNVHIAVLLHPDEIGVNRPTFHSCNYLNKKRLVLTYQGYNVCCSADGYIRLFGEEGLILDRLPNSIDGFDLDSMNRVCQHCAFGCIPFAAFEKEIGQPISKIYQEQANLNKQGRVIKKRFPSVGGN